MADNGEGFPPIRSQPPTADSPMVKGPHFAGSSRKGQVATNDTPSSISKKMPNKRFLVARPPAEAPATALVGPTPTAAVKE
jgi:hypothetical protein